MNLSVEALSALALGMIGALLSVLAFLVKHAFSSVIEELKGLREEIKELRADSANWRVLESRVELLEAQVSKILGE